MSSPTRLSGFPTGHDKAKPPTMSCYANEQRALATRPVVLKRPERQKSMCGLSQERRSKTPRGVLDPDDLTRRLYVVIWEREEAEKKRQRRVNTIAERAFRRGSRPPAGHPTAPSEPWQRDVLSRGVQDAGNGVYKTGPYGEELSHEGATSWGRNPPMTENRPPGTAQGSEPQSYRHVPQVAASQFESTTTSEAVDPTAIHKLSQQAMAFHMNGPEQDILRRNDNASPLETMHSMERVRSNRDREYDRNQFQHPPILEELNTHDGRQFRLPMRQTFETHFGKKKDDAACQRFSVSGAARHSLDVAGVAVHRERVGQSMDEEAPPMRMRTDWTQSDEKQHASDGAEQSKLRKTQSKWTLKGKLSTFQKSKENKENKPLDQITDEKTAQLLISPKSPSKSGFFGRFKR